MTDESLEWIFNEIGMKQDKLTGAERMYVDSFEEQYHEKGYLSGKQHEILNNIYERVTGV